MSHNNSTSDTQAIQAVLFDYGLVLSGPPHPPAWERMKAVLHTDEISLHRAYWRSRHEYDLGELSGVQYWAQVARDLDQSLDPDSVRALIAADTELWTQPNQAMIDWAAALQAAGVRTGILSNLGDEMELGVLRVFPWLNRFHHLTFSHRLRMAKPALAIYLHAAEGLGVAPSSVLFIDDREDNLEGARAAGMQAVRYTSHDAFVAAMQASGHGNLLSPATKV